MSLTCPNCKSILEVQVVSKPQRPPQRRDADLSPLTNKALAEVFEFMKGLPGTRPVHRTAGSLYASYLGYTKLSRPLSQTAFGMALRKNGAERWRTAAARGYTISEIPEEAKPARMTEAQQERFEEASYREAVLDHRGAPSSFTTPSGITVPNGPQPVASGVPTPGGIVVNTSPPLDPYIPSLTDRLRELPF